MAAHAEASSFGKFCQDMTKDAVASAAGKDGAGQKNALDMAGIFFNAARMQSAAAMDFAAGGAL